MVESTETVLWTENENKLKIITDFEICQKKKKNLEMSVLKLGATDNIIDELQKKIFKEIKD